MLDQIEYIEVKDDHLILLKEMTSSLFSHEIIQRPLVYFDPPFRNIFQRFFKLFEHWHFGVFCNCTLPLSITSVSLRCLEEFSRDHPNGRHSARILELPGGCRRYLCRSCASRT